MRRLQWFFVQSLERFSVLSWFVLLLLVVKVAFAVKVLYPSQQQLMYLQQQPKPKVQNTQTVDTRTIAIPLLENMPSTLELPKLLRTFYEVADESGLILDEVVYRDQKKYQQTVVRYHINFSVKATYPKVKLFIVNALAAIPYIALDQVTFDRDDIKDSEVTANLSFTLFMVQSS
jgi:Tfp pilus assembly protein PilO